MKYGFIFWGFFVIGSLITGCTVTSKENSEVAETLQPPKAEKIPEELTANGNKRIDNYYWMKLSEAQRDTDVKDEQTAKVINYLNEENTYLAANLEHTKALQDKLYNEMVGRIKQNDESVPYKNNGYWYYSRFKKGQEYPIHCRRKGTMSAAEEILLDVNELSKGHSYYSVQGLGRE